MSRLFKRNGVWYVWVHDRTRGWIRRSTKCTDRRAAEIAQKQFERDAADPQAAVARDTTSERILHDYLESRRMMGRSQQTVEYVEEKSGALLTGIPARASELTHASLSRYVQARLASGVMRTTVKKELGVLKPALRLAKKNGVWSGDPDAVIPVLDDDYKPRSRVLTPWELVGLCSVLPRTRAAQVAFIVATGARWGEAVRAQGQDVSLLAPVRVHLRGSKTEAADRIVPITGIRYSVLLWALQNATVGDALLFTPWANVRRDLAEACRKLGVAPVTPNDLRRTFGTWLREAGVEPQLIGAAMGHTTSRMVERVYGRLTPEALGRLLEERTSRPEARSADDGQTQPRDHAPAVGAQAGTDPVSATRGESLDETTGSKSGSAEATGGTGPCDRPTSGNRDQRRDGPERRAPSFGTGILVRCAPVVSASTRAQDAEGWTVETLGIPGNYGAQGQNRTADTRIFNQRVRSTDVRETAEDSTDIAPRVGDKRAVSRSLWGDSEPYVRALWGLP